MGAALVILEGIQRRYCCTRTAAYAGSIHNVSFSRQEAGARFARVGSPYHRRSPRTV